MRRAFFRCPPLACGFDPIRRVPVGAEGLQLRLEPPLGVEQLLRLVAPHPVFELASAAPGPSSRRPSAPGGLASSLRACARRPRPGAVQPFGVRRTIIGQRGRNGVPLLRACFWTARMSATHLSIVAAIAWCIDSGSDPSTKYGVQPCPAEERLDLVVRDARPDRRVVDLVPVEVEDRQHGAVADRVEELVDVPARRQRPGLGLAVADDGRDDQVRVVERRPAGVRQARSRVRRLRGSSPGVSGVQWLPIPPGNENCLKSRSIPSSSSLQSG